MLQQFEVNNYRGFSQPLVWNLAHTGDYSFHENLICDGIVKNGIVFGRNGSGKSNLGLALFDIVNHISQRRKLPYYYDNFVYAGGAGSVVEFAYTFRFDGQKLYYAYAKGKDGGLRSERLEVEDVCIFAWDSDIFFLQEGFGINVDVQRGLRESENKASLINFLYSTMPLPAGHYLIRLKEFVDKMLWFRSLEDRDFIGFDETGSNIEEFIIQHDLVVDFAQFLAEVSEQNFSFLPAAGDDKRLYCKIGEGRVLFSTLESTGTSALTLLYYWLQRLSDASFVFIDEYDAFYHFALSRTVVQRLFNQPCQLFVSSHNTALMSHEILRPDCCFVINGCDIKAFDQCTQKDLQWGHNLEKLYRGNTFGL